MNLKEFITLFHGQNFMNKLECFSEMLAEKATNVPIDWGTVEGSNFPRKYLTTLNISLIGTQL
jgi:hypothetical protein